MSKKYNRTKTQAQKNTRPQRVSQQSAKQQQHEESSLLKLAALLARDGYTNEAAFLGESSPLVTSGTFQRSFLTQNVELLTTAYRESWLAMRIIDMPCEDMTRSWYRLATEMDEDDLRKLKRLDAKHSVKQEIANAIRWARLYGGSIAVMAIRDQGDQLDQPLDLNSIAPGDFQGLLVLDRAQGIQPSVELEDNIDDPDFGLPMYYTVDLDVGEYQNVKVHHSRCLRFIGRELPRLETINENYWGASELEHIWDELQKRNSASANIAQLLFQANITTLKMGDFGEALALGTDDQRENVVNAMMMENRFRTSYGLQVLSANDTMENHQYTFSGISDVYEQFMMDICGAAEIPATKLFGRSPQGFNSTGESDLRNYYDLIAQMQERQLRPALEKLVPVMALSCWGYVPDDMEIVFEPIAAITPADRADLVNKVSDPIIKAFQAKLITRGEAIAELKNAGTEYGVWTKLSDPKDDPNMNEYSDEPEVPEMPEDDPDADQSVDIFADELLNELLSSDKSPD